MERSEASDHSLGGKLTEQPVGLECRRDELMSEENAADVLNYISKALSKQKCQAALLSGHQDCGREGSSTATPSSSCKSGDAQVQHWAALNNVQIQVKYLFRS